MKKLIILLSLIFFTSCGSFQLSTIGYTPTTKTRIIIEPQPSIYYQYPVFPYRYYTYYNQLPTYIVVNHQKSKIRIKGRRKIVNRKKNTRSTSVRRINDNKRN